MASFWQTSCATILRLLGLGGRGGSDVGLVCSTGNDRGVMNEFIAQFEKGLGDKVTPEFAHGDYNFKHDLKKLEKLADDFIKGKKKVLVATGGIMTFQAAVNISSTANKVPILFLIGIDAGITNANISGGIYLNMPKYNVQRVAALRQKYLGGSTSKKIALLVNDNGALPTYERANWVDDWGPIVPVGAGRSNNQIDLPAAATELNKSDAIIVSSDPYLMSRRADLAPLLKKPVCYPFEEYFHYATKGQSMRYGPDLAGAYHRLGELANEVLKQVEGGIPIPNVGTSEAVNTESYY
jgi:hypothetical protein